VPAPRTIPLPLYLAPLLALFPPHTLDRIFFVGGTVRDILLNRPSHDVDLIAALYDNELENLAFRRVLPRSAAPIYFRSHNQLGKIEVTTIGTTDELESDLRRRDVTVNAMALSLTGDFIDPLNGYTSLRRRELHPCSPMAFLTDPLRIFRLFRFEAHGWRMTSDAEGLIREREWCDAFSHMPVERFSGELLKALAGNDPSRFFRRMIEFGVGEGFLPEIFRMKDIPAGPVIHHPEGDLFTHSLQVMERVCAVTDDVVARFCALFHDLGKLSTPPEHYPKHHGHDEAGFCAARPLCDRLALPATYRNTLRWVNRLHTTANRWEELRSGTKIRLAEDAVRGGVAGILPLIAAADKPYGGGMSEWEEAVSIVQLPTAELGIDPRLLATLPREGIVPLPPEQRPALIHQRRVEMFRAVSDIKNELPRENRFDTGDGV
jgi:tRNA nucleotidyltransferase (CCA-adding enzyme)